MDETSQQYNSKRKIPANLKAILILIAFIIISLLALNYFNIIPFGKFNRALFNLPHRPYSGVPNKLASTPTPAFSYDSQIATALLTQYLKDNLKPEFLPTPINIKQGLSIDNRTSSLKYEFGSYFTSSGVTVSANFHYKQNSNNPNDYTLYVLPAKINQVDATTTNSLLNTYFNKPFTVSNCITGTIVSSCENFQTLSDEKRGYGVAISNQTKQTVVFTCSLPNGSTSYSQTSCINQR